jgi:hypothetical protein
MDSGHPSFLGIGVVKHHFINHLYHSDNGHRFNIEKPHPPSSQKQPPKRGKREKNKVSFMLAGQGGLNSNVVANFGMPYHFVFM